MSHSKVINQPLIPKQVIDALRFSELNTDSIRTEMQGFNLTVPAFNVIAGTNSNTIDIPNGEIALIYGMNRITSDTFSPDIRFNILWDELHTDISFTGGTLDDVQDPSITYFAPFENRITYTFFNDLSNEIRVSVNVQFVIMNRGFYNSIYRRLVNDTFKQLEDLSQEVKFMETGRGSI